MVHTFVQIIFMFAVVPVIIIIAIFSDRKKKRRIFDEIEKSLPGEGKLSLFQSCFKGEYGGILFEMSIESTRSGNIVRIKIVKESEFQLSLYKKAFGTIMLHKIDLEDEPGYENILASASGIDEESARMFLRNQRKADKIK